MRRAVFRIAISLAACAAATARAETFDSNLVQQGALTYQTNCQTCHGEDLLNNGTVSFDLRRLKADEHERFVNSVTNGKNAMPSWDGVLSDADLDALWAYIRTNANDK